jgi:glycosyltransferase involved in cell wall biosynthesis
VESFRFAIITETLPPAKLNLQPWRYLGDLARALRDEGHEVSFLTSDAEQAELHGIRVDRHPTVADFRSLRGLRNQVRSRTLDAGIFRLTAGLFFSARRDSTEGPPSGRLAGIFLRPLHSGRDLARRFLDPTLADEIRIDRHHAAMYASRRLGAWPAAVPLVEDFVFLWESDRRSGTDAGLPDGASHVARHPFDPFFLDRRRMTLSPRLSGALPPVSRRVVFSGPPEGTRGVLDMMRLPRALPAETPTQVLLLLRDPRFREPRVARTRVGVHERVVVEGLVTREELKAIYQASDVAVFPYRFVRTGLPLVALEAVAAGLPVVTTRVHPLRELEGNTGLVFVNPRDPWDLARAVQETQDQDRRQDIRRRNEAWIRSNPDWRTVARSFVSFLS